MSEQPDEQPDDPQPDRGYEVSIVTFPEAASPFEAYLMMVDSLIRFGTDQFHAVVLDRETGQQWLISNDGQAVSEQAVHQAALQLGRDLDEQTGRAGTEQG